MINRQALLADLQKFLQRIEADLLERSESTEVPEVPAALQAEYEKAAKAERTAQNYEDWRTDTITQAAAAWVLSCVFVRFLEDNSLIDPPKIAGPGDRLARARDEHELYFRSHPQHTDREYLLSIFAELAKLPGTKDIFGEHNAINDLPNWLSGDAAGELLNFFQTIDAGTGELVHDFADSNWDTRFLGDLYQDLSEAARKTFALLQTPEFVEQFILDRTLEPALDEFGLAPIPKEPCSKDDSHFKMIDPACGSGHFLLGAFSRILARWQQKEPATHSRELTQKALDSVFGIDVNPFAVAIARFRLILAAMKSSNIHRLKDAPKFNVNIACGDSLLHGHPSGDQLTLGWTDCDHTYQVEDIDALRRILRPLTYHAVVANPPYIQVKDKARNRAYRERYSTASGKYSLSAPFLERLFSLAIVSGYVGQITANSFMKRKFGKKLIERHLPRIDLQYVLDTSFAEIPGHSTPTVILFGQNRKPVTQTVRCVMGIRGEASPPLDASQGAVWNDIAKLIDQAGSQTTYISVADMPRESLSRHPWSIGGGGASELKELLDENADLTLKNFITAVGITAVPGEDAVFLLENDSGLRNGLESTRPIVVGDAIRDWRIHSDIPALWVYDDSFNLLPIESMPRSGRWLWPYRSVISKRKRFGTSMVELGYAWYEWQEIYPEKLRTSKSIALALIATHNHFAIDVSGRLFKNSVYVIKLKDSCDNNIWHFILGLLNSSTGCFWLKQVCFPKGTVTGDISTEKGRPEANRYDFGTKSLLDFPVPDPESEEALAVTRISSLIVECVTKFDQLEPFAVIHHWQVGHGTRCLTECLRDARQKYEQLTTELKQLQRELDVATYACFKLLESQGELYLAMRDSLSTCLAIPHEISLIEAPSFVRQWFGRQGVYGSASSTFEEKQVDSLKNFLLTRLEQFFDCDGRMGGLGRESELTEIALYTVGSLADCARRDELFMQAGESYRDDAAFDVLSLVRELVLPESVPSLPVLRYKPSGILKRETWLRTWALQRNEDLIRERTKVSNQDPEYLSNDEASQLVKDQVGSIPNPGKYDSKDFIESHFWRLRGKLDVPKERWISFPHCEGPDGTLVICWAGYDHLQQAQAISAYYVRVQTEFGGSDDPRLIPLLASLIELLPWLKQWHNEPNANFDGLRMGDYFEGFVNEEARNLGKTLAEIKAWVPPKKSLSKKRKSSARSTERAEGDR